MRCVALQCRAAPHSTATQRAVSGVNEPLNSYNPGTERRSGKRSDVEDEPRQSCVRLFVSGRPSLNAACVDHWRDASMLVSHAAAAAVVSLLMRRRRR